MKKAEKGGTLPWKKKPRDGTPAIKDLHGKPSQPEDPVNRLIHPVRSFFGLKKPEKFTRPAGQTFTIEVDGGYPSVIISAKAHGKMRALVQECDIEIGWLSSVVRRDNGDFEIVDVYVPQQECTMSTTEITADGEAELMTWLMSNGRTQVINQLRCWGHSHVNMSVFASGTDKQQTDEFVNRFDDFFVRFIANKRDELLCNVYLRDDDGKRLILNNPPMIVLEDDIDHTEWAREQIDSKVINCQGVYGPYSGKDLDWSSINPDLIEGGHAEGLFDEECYDDYSPRLETHESQGGSVND